MWASITDDSALRVDSRRMGSGRRRGRKPGAGTGAGAGVDADPALVAAEDDDDDDDDWAASRSEPLPAPDAIDGGVAADAVLLMCLEMAPRVGRGSTRAELLDVVPALSASDRPIAPPAAAKTAEALAVIVLVEIDVEDGVLDDDDEPAEGVVRRRNC